MSQQPVSAVPEGQERTLLQVLEGWDQAWASKDAAALRDVLSPNATLQADGVLFEKDVQGADKIIEIHEHYFAKYDYEHKNIVKAVNADTNAAFGFWIDYSLHRRTEEEAAAAPASTISGIWKLKIDPDSKKVADIFFLRQLHAEEAEHKLKDPASIVKGGVEPERFPCGDQKAGEELRAAARCAANGLSSIWQTGNVFAAETLMAEDVRSVDLLHGGEKVGRQQWCDMVSRTFKCWTPISSSIDVGVAPDGRTALIHWTTEGKMSDTEQTFSTYGLNAICMDPDSGKIKEMAGFRQLSPPERKDILRPDAFAKKAEA